MTTRIRYKKSGNTLFVGNSFQVLDKVYTPRYNINNHIAEIMVGDEVYLYFVFSTVNEAKYRLKRHLKQLGVKFDPEVRRKKEHKQELQKAIEGKQE
jgi:hypothetical protein